MLVPALAPAPRPSFPLHGSTADLRYTCINMEILVRPVRAYVCMYAGETG